MICPGHSLVELVIVGKKVKPFPSRLATRLVDSSFFFLPAHSGNPTRWFKGASSISLRRTVEKKRVHEEGGMGNRVTDRWPDERLAE